MSNESKLKRYPKNVPGDFFVEDGMCISCGAPEDAAPDLMTHDESDELGYHCYFKKQPSTPEELEQAIQAVACSCCEGVQYGGDDPKVRQRLVEIGEENFRRMQDKEARHRQWWKFWRS
ncbi:MAG: ferredoxin [Pyrinomonadaceae bacterium MAG19_C2-C3]|nr:ferredoxin [Pyrinomonadaceae bacterium MAG19_C2-C3]